ncbi:MAG TPA: hypothetical protein VHZ26_14790 [Caulobacteraceae bacterium]|jgi:hypothetical protein|nr:hypothetical protein [Caulobacteraceae bacterium]
MMRRLLLATVAAALGADAGAQTLGPPPPSAPLTLTATIGETAGNGNPGTGILGIGAPPATGFGLYMDGPPINMTDGGEQIGGRFAITNVPTSAVALNTGIFGLLGTAFWRGSADSSQYGIAQGIQGYVYVQGSPSLGSAVGMEGGVVDSATAGTVVNPVGVHGFIQDAGAGGHLTNSTAFQASITGSGNNNDSIGFEADSLAGAHVFGVYVKDQTLGTSSNYAIYTNAGGVHFGGATDISGTLQTTGTYTSHGDLNIDAGHVLRNDGGILFLDSAPGAAIWLRPGGVVAMHVDQNLHVSYAGTAPALTSCGGAPAISGTDVAGKITVGTSATACTATFAIAYGAAPSCVVADQTALSRLTSYAVSTTAIVLSMTSNSGDVVDYVCNGA